MQKNWVAYVNSEILLSLEKNVPQDDLLKLLFEEGVNNVQGTTFSLQFYTKIIRIFVGKRRWASNLIANFIENFQKTGLLLLVNSNL